MANLNRVLLIGRLVRDPDARRTSNGTSVAKLGLAINRKFKNAAGEKQEEVTFADVDVWGRSADFCRDYLRKGAPVYVEGRLKLDQWEDRETGQKRSKLGIVAESVQSLGTRSENQAPQQQQTPAPPFPEQQQNYNAAPNQPANVPYDGEDDQPPF